MRTTLLSISWVVMLAIPNCMLAQTLDFTEISTQSSIIDSCSPATYGAGISMFDFNSDGLDDLTLGGVENEEPRFYQNNGNGFTEINIPTIDLSDHHQKCLLWVDYDNDGDYDLSSNNLGSTSKLFRNDGNLSFTDIGTTSGFDGATMYSYAGAWGDYDLNGLLDHYIGNRDLGANGSANRLLHNNGFDTFVDMTLPSMSADTQGYGFGVAFIDYDRNGLPDIFIANDKLEAYNCLLENNGDGSFSDVSDPNSTGMSIDGMGLGIADFDGNGYEDIYVTNTPESINLLVGNIFCQNNGDGTFTEIGGALDLRVEEIGWGANWADFDNDGDLDLFVANFSLDGVANSIFLNQGNGTFIEDTLTQIGLVDDRTFGSAIGDVNNDGYPDIAVMNESPSTVKIWQNDGGTNNWVKITLEGTYSNRMAVGSWVEIFAGNISSSRYTRCGTSYGSQDGAALMFGLGNNAQVDSLRINWPNGTQETYSNLAANQSHHFVEGGLVAVDTPTGITRVNLYPNPSDGTFTIEFNGSEGRGSIQVRDIAGKLVYSEAVSISSNFKRSFNIDVAEGTYVLRIQTIDGLITRKLEIR